MVYYDIISPKNKCQRSYTYKVSLTRLTKHMNKNNTKTQASTEGESSQGLSALHREQQATKEG